MRVVVAGSSGLIGTALVAALRQAGHGVIRLVRRRPAAIDERRWDPPAGRLDDGALDDADAVINLCGVSLGAKRWSGEFKQAIRNSRIEPTEVLARAVAERGIATMVNASGVGYYGDTGDAEVDESAPSGASFLAEVCRDWEAATAPAAGAGARVVLLRSGVVISRWGGLLGRLRPIFSMLLGGRFGNGRQFSPWISLDDEVGAIRFLTENDQVRGPVNLVGPQQVTNAEFTRELASALGRPAPWVLPGFALRVVVGEFADESALIGQRVSPRVLQQHGFRFAHPTLRSALDAAIDR
jgi:uncharacterized protein (TIGR01777 family)